MTADLTPLTMKTPAPRLEDLPPDLQLQVRKSARVLQARWEGRMNVETIERFLVESLDLLKNARVLTWTPVIAEIWPLMNGTIASRRPIFSAFLVTGEKRPPPST